MDDAPFTGDLDLGAANTRDDLGVLLRTVHTRADKPSLRTLEARTRHSTTPLSKTAIAEMLKGVRFPRKAVMVTFLQACGVPEDGLESWRRTWERVAASEEASARPKAVQTASGWQGHAAVAGQYPLPVIRGAEVIARPGRADHGHLASEMPATADLTGMRQLREQINWLNGENERLRTQLAAMKPQVVKELSSNDTASSQRAQSPVVCRRDLGTLLRTLRAEKGMTVEQVAEHLMCSQTKVRRMESGFRSGTIRDVRDLCDLYGVTEAAERDRLMELARAGKQQSWWEVYGLPFSTYVGLEMEAASIKTYESSLVPGLVQTEDYARAMIESWVELSPEVIEHSPEVIEKGVEGRLIRQRRLGRVP